jgi:flavin-dependent dehydrogenase
MKAVYDCLVAGAGPAGGLLVGDAASLADPLLGEGIYYAMRSAQLAAQVTGEPLEGALDLSSYTQLIDTQIRGEFRYARLMAEIYYPLPALGYQLCKGSKVIREGIITVIQGKTRYGEFFWSVMRNLPRVLSEELR